MRTIIGLVSLFAVACNTLGSVKVTEHPIPTMAISQDGESGRGRCLITQNGGRIELKATVFDGSAYAQIGSMLGHMNIDTATGCAIYNTAASIALANERSYGNNGKWGTNDNRLAALVLTLAEVDRKADRANAVNARIIRGLALAPGASASGTEKTAESAPTATPASAAVAPKPSYFKLELAATKDYSELIAALDRIARSSTDQKLIDRVAQQITVLQVEANNPKHDFAHDKNEVMRAIQETT